MNPEYGVEFEYLVDVDGLSLRHRHRARVELFDPLNPPTVGTDPSDIELSERGGVLPATPRQLDIGMNDYLTVVCALYGANMTIVSGVLVYYPNGIGRAGIYISPLDMSGTGTITAIAGTNANPSSPTRQANVTFFDSRGKVSKFTYLETTLSSNDRVAIGDLSLEYANLVSYMVSDTSVIKGAETSVLLSGKNASFGQNEAIWRKRHRS